MSPMPSCSGSALRYADLRDTLVHLAERGKTLLFRRRSVIEILHSTAFLEACVWPRTIPIFFFTKQE
jgi:hypothetical protein